MRKQKISVVVIAKNEQTNIIQCLKSANWADEIVVIDNGSTDKTAILAKQFKAKVYSYPQGSYKDLRNEGFKKASCEWVFYLDADERVTSDLAEEIIGVISSGNAYAAYALPRQNIILGRIMHHGGWWPDYVKRLFQKDKLLGWKGDLHEEPEYTGSMGYLKKHIIHQKHADLNSMAEKTNSWSNTEAQLLYSVNHPQMASWRFFRVMFTEFMDRLVKKRGFLDGSEGWVYAYYQAYSKFLTYAKLWEKQL